MDKTLAFGARNLGSTPDKCTYIYAVIYFYFMSTYKQALLEAIISIKKKQPKNRVVVYLEGGYYDTRFGPQDFSFNTLSACMDITKELIKKQYGITRVVLGILANNIGQVCGEDSCVIAINVNKNDNENVELPQSLGNIINNTGFVTRDQVMFTTEKNLRNRGIKLIKNLIKKPQKYSLIMDKKTESQEICSIVIEGKKIPLAIKKGETWAARCPLIMGQHYVDIFIKNAKKFGSSTNQIIIDMCEMYDRHKVNNGAKFARLLLHRLYGYNNSNIHIINCCFQDDELMEYELDVTHGSI